MRQVVDERQHREKTHALDLVNDAVVALDRHGHITYLNRAAENFYGWTAAELVGQLARTTLFGDSKPAFDTAWRTVRKNGEWRGEFAQQTKSGDERVLEARWSAVHDQDSSRLTSVLIAATEIPKVNLTTANLAHEIRNPLAGIKGVADTFLQRRQLTPQEREWMEAVLYGVMKIDARMRELLTLSQPRAFNARKCVLSESIARVIALAMHQTKSRRVSVQFIDATTERLSIFLDPARIEDAVLNLVLNGIEAIEGSGCVTVCLRRGPKRNNGNDEALIEITDTGRGIPLEIRARIFEPLFTTKTQGTGLGLAAVRRTAAAYHGRISFTSKIGRGSKFVLALPLRSQPNPAENPK
jgi:two-component system cell cycle sensor histidine kinase/response regulator CckA